VKVKTLRDDMLIGTVIHPKGSIVEMDDHLAQRWLNVKPSPPIAAVVEIELAALAPALETSEIAPKGRRRAAAVEA
jgi:hypothetical protein